MKRKRKKSWKEASCEAGGGQPPHFPAESSRKLKSQRTKSESWNALAGGGQCRHFCSHWVWIIREKQPEVRHQKASQRVASGLDLAPPEKILFTSQLDQLSYTKCPM